MRALTYNELKEHHYDPNAEIPFVLDGLSNNEMIGEWP
jgi:hypothetical protein